MKLISLRLCNFRQFYGETPTLELAAGAERRITILHGNNGAGKTALLNAFTWVLFEKFTAAFASPERLVNQRAIAEAKPGDVVECWVELMFEHGGNRYRVRRTCKALVKQADSTQTKSELAMKVEMDDRWKLPEQPPEDIINRILPESLHQYFFFDGERIEQIVRSDKKKEISEAIRKLLGVEVVDRAANHLNDVRKMLEKELETIGDPETKKLLREQETLQTECDRIEKRQEEIAQELENHQAIQQELQQKLRELEGVSQLQKQRDFLQTQEDRDRAKLQQTRTALKLAISSQGYTVLLGDATAKFRNLVAGLRQRGELPTDIKQQFVRDLLERGRCICGSTLCEGTEAFTLVQEYLTRAGLADVEETVIRMTAQVEEIDRRVPEFWEEVDRLQETIQTLNGSLSKIENELASIREKLLDSSSEDVQQLERRLEETDRRLEDLTYERRDNDRQLKDRQTAIQDLMRRIKEHRMTEEKQQLARRRVEATTEAIARLKQVQTNVGQLFRADLEERMQELFGQISFTPYQPKLTDKYELMLMDGASDRAIAVAASTGENQILSLSFIGSIIDRVRQWSRAERGRFMGPDTDTFPIVMDSPFGTLDEIYRRQVAKSIPVLANQLVVLVTKTQWRGEVEQEMSPTVGRQYVLVYNSPKPDCERDAIAIGGKEYPLVRPSPNAFEYTEILEVQL